MAFLPGNGIRNCLRKACEFPFFYIPLMVSFSDNFLTSKGQITAFLWMKNIGGNVHLQTIMQSIPPAPWAILSVSVFWPGVDEFP